MFHVRSSAAQILAVAALVAATGCGAEIPGTDGAKISKDGDSFKVETDQGSMESSASIPDDFPEDEVPLLDGKILNATSFNTDAERGYTIAMQVDGLSIQDAADQGAALLEEAGFVAEGSFDAGEMKLTTFNTDTWVVSLSASTGEDAVTVSYTVGEKSAE